MFEANSRYANLPIVEVETAKTQKVNAVKLRRLPTAAGTLQRLRATDRLDIMAHRKY